MSALVGIILSGAVTAGVTWASKKLLDIGANSVVYTGILTFLLVTLLAIWNINIALPDEIYKAITSDNVRKVFYSVGFFIPLKFILQCLAVLIFSRYFDFCLTIVSKIWMFTFRLLFGIAGGKN